MTCSPVEAITSSSRGLASGLSSLASASRRLVSPDMAEGTTTSWWPSRAKRRHALRDLADALGAAHGSAAVLLDDQGHEGRFRGKAAILSWRAHQQRMNWPTAPAASSHFAALALGVAATLLAWYIAGRQADREIAGRIHEPRQPRRRTCWTGASQRYVDVLYGLEALAYHEPALRAHAVLAATCRRSRSHRRFPGVTALGFIRARGGRRARRVRRQVRADRSFSPNGYLRASTSSPAGDARRILGGGLRRALRGQRGGRSASTSARVDAARSPPSARATGRGHWSRDAIAWRRSAGASYGLVLYLPVYGPATVPHARRAPRGPARLRERRAAGGRHLRRRARTSPAARHRHAHPRRGDRARRGRRHALDGRCLLFHARLATGRRKARVGTGPRQETRDISVAGRQWRLEYLDEPGAERVARALSAAGPGLRRVPESDALRGTARPSRALAGRPCRSPGTPRASCARSSRSPSSCSRPSPTRCSSAIRMVAISAATARTRSTSACRATSWWARPPTTWPPTTSPTARCSPTASSSRSPAAQTYESSVVYAPDGLRHDVLINKAAFLDPNGEIAGLVGVAGRHHRAQARSRAATHESIERLRAVIQAAPRRDHRARPRPRHLHVEPGRGADVRLEGVRGARDRRVDRSARTCVEQAQAMRIRALAGETHLGSWRRAGCTATAEAIDVALSVAPIYGAEGTGDRHRRNAHRHLAAQAGGGGAARKRVQPAPRDGRGADGHVVLGVRHDRFTHSDGLQRALRPPGRRAACSNYASCASAMHADDRELVDATLRHAIKQGEDFTVDFRVVWPDGSVHWIANRGQVHRGADGRAQRLIGVAMNITERKIAEQRVAHMAHHDALTGLPNRVLLRDRIEQAIAQAHRNGAQLAVLFLDLDRFKTINDSLGHQLGDRLLQSVASRILVCVREGDTVSRVGGDEFVIVIPGIGSSSDASSVAAQDPRGACKRVPPGRQRPARDGLHRHQPLPGRRRGRRNAHAQRRHRHVPRQGLGARQLPVLHAAHERRRAAAAAPRERAARARSRRGEFELHYQPLFDLRDRTRHGLRGAAALEAARRRGHGRCRANSSPSPRTSGLIVPIGEWVLREALRHAKSWQVAGAPAARWPSTSRPRSFRAPCFVERLRRLARTSSASIRH